MGCFQSYSVFTDHEIQVYQDLTQLNTAEILHAYKKFQNIDPMAFEGNKKGKISFITVAESLPELSQNPFRYRICKVFCSSDQGFMDFDDFLDLISVMHDNTHLATKLSWAFKIYDFNEDESICPLDMNQILDNLSGGALSQHTKNQLIEQILKEADKDNDGALNYHEFERVMSLNAAPDFMENFRFRL